MRWEEERFQKWEKKWLDSIAADISLLHTHRTIFHEVQTLLTHHPTGETRRSEFREFLHDAYVALIVSSVRKQGKSDPEHLSLARLLEEIGSAPTVLSRARFVALYADTAIGGAEWKAMITATFAGRGQEHVDPYLVKHDLEALKDEVRTAEAYVDHYFAQRDQRGLRAREIPIHKELDESVEFLFALMKKYYFLFRATALTPSLIAPSWKDIFRSSERIA
ncbi:MAG TPA: hypothetical protein VGX03_16750 [Candidatus Binatia bacterium]|jgi:hypothetical protein|nr:hypothetical protein [Candidatus Binatia bacterium]